MGCKFGTARRGKQGLTGAPGAPGSEVFSYTQGSTNINATTDITVFASASASGTLIYDGYINLRSAVTPVQATLTPVINGVAQTALATICNLPPQIGGICPGVIPVVGFITITAGDSFKINIALNSYVLSTAALFTSVNYTIQL